MPDASTYTLIRVSRPTFEVGGREVRVVDLQLRLVAGPLNDAGAAARICAVLTENKRPCETAIFDGQRLTLKSDDPPPTATKPVPHRRGVAKRAAAVVEEVPKKPEAPPAPTQTTQTTLSSFFNRKSSQ